MNWENFVVDTKKCRLCKRQIPCNKRMNFRPPEAKRTTHVCRECFEKLFDDYIDDVKKMFEMRLEHRLVLVRKTYPWQEEKSIAVNRS